MNEHDMEKVRHLLHVAGFEAASAATDADVVIVNTCCVREKAEQKFYSLMGRLRRLKAKSTVVLGVMGCVAQLEKEHILEKLPFIDFSLGTSNVHRVEEAIRIARTEKRKLLSFSENGCEASLHVRPGGKGRLRSFVTIMKGCDNFCSYCVVPYVRGREKSRKSSDIIEEVKELAAGGVREVTLLGQNVNSYNKGSDDCTFAQLLEKINDIDGLERIRFVTSHPKDLSPDLIRCFGRLEKLCEQIHLPFQSGSNRILGLMNRGYTAEEYLGLVHSLRKQCPGIAITADCIVGFPGERGQDFSDTQALVEEVRFDGLFSFCYSPRPETRAATLPDRVPREIAMERLKGLQATQKIITREKNCGLEGSTVEVLVEGSSKSSPEEFAGRTRTNRIVNFAGSEDLVGSLVELKVVKGYANSLRGAIPRPKEGGTC
ncbi:MAG TPA: tRNA (N6-isopentenyl adenosine(37)-C2)-methylthiotransferase MiaB [Deltaproteobacteria bacterium]|nr:tRNA (N6-isopentenyl adenosine(37)-C2)-methylthiotransferase MiaB [Deltaproteobacteria bacterium]